MATSPLSVAVDGTDGNSGIHMDLIQAAREGRPNGRAGIGGRATLAKVGELMIWGRSTASSSSAAPPEPARLPSTATPVPDSAPTADTSTQEASGSTGSAQQTPMRPPIISEEYCEINGQPHYKRLLADGTIEYESW